MKPIAEDIKSILVTAGVGSATPTADWSIHIGTEPAQPNKVLTIYDTGGEGSGYYLNSAKKPTVYDTFQVRVRGMTYTEAYAKLSSVLDALDQKNHFTLAGLGSGETTKYGGIFMLGRPVSLPKDDNGRSLWVVNFRVVREKIS